MGRNEMLSINEVRLFTPFRYDNDAEGTVWMLIGAPSTRMGNHFIGLSIRRGFIYCETLPSFDLIEPAKGVSTKKFIRALLAKCEWDDQQMAAFKIGMGKDGRDQSKLLDFS